MDSQHQTPHAAIVGASQLVTARVVAEHLGMSPAWVLDRWQAGGLPGYRLGQQRGPVRFRLVEIEEWLAERHEGPRAA